MSELKPGTPEYDKAYQDEMTRLEAEAGGKPKDEAKPKDATPSTDKVDANPEIERLEKRLKDTQRMAHQAATEASRLRKDAEERERLEREARVKPLFDANPGLKEAIEIVSPKPKEKSADEIWLETVQRVVPDVEDLLGDQAFHAKAKSRQAELGEAWTDPLVASRELSELKASHMSERATKQAVEAARKDFEEKAKKRSAMEVPGGSGSRATTEVPDDDAKKWRDMPTNDFRKERAKVMGHQG